MACEYKLFSSTHTFKHCLLFLSILHHMPADPHAVTPQHHISPLTCILAIQSHLPSRCTSGSWDTCKSPTKQNYKFFPYYVTHLSRFMATQDMAYHCTLLQGVDEKFTWVTQQKKLPIQCLCFLLDVAKRSVRLWSRLWWPKLMFSIIVQLTETDATLVLVTVVLVKLLVWQV
jgi:hypothetical protein